MLIALLVVFYPLIIRDSYLVYVMNRSLIHAMIAIGPGDPGRLCGTDFPGPCGLLRHRCVYFGLNGTAFRLSHLGRVLGRGGALCTVQHFPEHSIV